MGSRILVVDDHALVRQALCKLLAGNGFEVVGEADNGFDGLEKAREVQPEVVLIDLYMPKLDGIATTRLIRRELPNVEVVVLTASEDEEHIVEAVQAGARGYVFKSADSLILLKQLRQVLSGGVGMSEHITTKLVTRLAQGGGNHRNSGVDAYNTLTQREKEVLALITQGQTNKAIGCGLHISANTVRAHVRCLMQKMNLDNRTQLAVHGLAEGLCTSPRNRAPSAEKLGAFKA